MKKFFYNIHIQNLTQKCYYTIEQFLNDNEIWSPWISSYISNNKISTFVLFY